MNPNQPQPNNQPYDPAGPPGQPAAPQIPQAPQPVQQFQQPASPEYSTPPAQEMPAVPMQPGQPGQPVQPTAAPASFGASEPTVPAEGEKSYIGAMLLSALLGVLGIDRFYLGYTGLGIAKLLTLGGLGIWAAVDFILIALGKVTDKQGLPLKGFDKNRKVGLILIGLYIVWIVASLVMLPGRLKDAQTQLEQSGTSATSLSEAKDNLADVGPDQERQNDLRSLQGQMEAYAATKNMYPTLAETNDANFRKTYLIGAEDANFKDPEGSSSQLVATPQAKAYSYQPTPAGCNNAAVRCTSFVLTAILGDGQQYTREGFGL